MKREVTIYVLLHSFIQKGLSYFYTRLRFENIFQPNALSTATIEKTTISTLKGIVEIIKGKRATMSADAPKNSKKPELVKSSINKNNSESVQNSV
ncbi:MAG: hypothetical protein NXI01_03490 [Gammaproteobacteria bacterium]|nr:hypothetical protein [Gammaproteobacteria bacterium]